MFDPRDVADANIIKYFFNFNADLQFLISKDPDYCFVLVPGRSVPKIIPIALSHMLGQILESGVVGFMIVYFDRVVIVGNGVAGRKSLRDVSEGIMKKNLSKTTTRDIVFKAIAGDQECDPQDVLIVQYIALLLPEALIASMDVTMANNDLALVES